MSESITLDYMPPEYKISVDSEGYLQSFNLSQEAEFKKFFDDYGFVIVNGILNPKECEETIDDIWSVIGEYVEGIDRNDPTTWTEQKWKRTGIYKEGLVGGGSLFTRRSMLNRQNPNLFKVFSVLLGTEDLLVNQDRYGFFRPTNSVKLADGTTKSFSERKTVYNVHLDMNPWSFIELKTPTNNNIILNSLRYVNSLDWIVENNQPGVANPEYFQLNIQSALNLADNKAEDGGLHIVPGFHRHFAEWTQSRKNLRQTFGVEETFCLMPNSEPMVSRAVRASARSVH
eukprot:TRINITY_DN7951_c0_g1_i1.p1 TRINITY_DN7951_c0_g1~~TRINITY_DN7951_c0_g1_i1.p1  ORF type:complete len:304 (-),score=47.28 TRINITY_DN7951_c0_g1_i1:288-1145(-)